MLKPIGECVKKAALNEKIETKYPELEPIAEMMNKMNADIAEKMNEINAEKEQVVKATASKNDFIANITHEMNTPLTSIKGFAELLNTDLPEEQKKKAVETILKQSERLSNLVACVINYNQLDNENLPPYEVNLSKIVRETTEILRPDMEKRNLTLSLDAEEDVIVFSRHERIVEIVGNLIRNAIKYNKENGIIIVSVTGGETPKLVVRDTGIGVSEENKEKIRVKKKKERFENEYQTFVKNSTFCLNDNLWDDVTLKDVSGIGTDSFFSTYEKYFTTGENTETT